MTSARVLVVDDDPAIRKIVADRLRAQQYEVERAESGEAALEVVERFEPHLVLSDIKMPGMDGLALLERLKARRPSPEVIMMTAHGTIQLAVEALQKGAADFVEKPFEAARLDHVVRQVLETAGLRARIERLETELSGRHTLVEGKSPAMEKALTLARRAAASDSTILLLGESGTGKEVLARHIHQQSARAGGPFVAVNCAVLSPELMESELFGHERGAFTGADRLRTGRIEAAAGGTLFLDEMGELAPAVQAKLLRVLQEREFERLGGTKTLQADVRVIAATHRDLRAAVDAGAFREDLYYRLAVISLALPPLRERTEDLPELIGHFLQRRAADAGRKPMRVAPAAMERLLQYGWPGNIRELNNVIERAVVLAPGDVIEVEDLPEELTEAATAASAATTSVPPPRADGAPLPFREAVVEAKRRIILDALDRTGGHQTKAAELLGMGQPYLARLMKNLRVPKR